MSQSIRSVLHTRAPRSTLHLHCLRKLCTSYTCRPLRLSCLPYLISDITQNRHHYHRQHHRHHHQHHHSHEDEAEDQEEDEDDDEAGGGGGEEGVKGLCSVIIVTLLFGLCLRTAVGTDKWSRTVKKSKSHHSRSRKNSNWHTSEASWHSFGLQRAKADLG